ncbi:FAD-dependent oxidoreductase [Streptomyces sp. ODS28]|uniref:NAD(P)/FAD-dependent oxidoreductase n=1 Tax=Streptomyces sp. ODS28 TaxID=3136688 RepID=UPI0031EF5444
MSAGRTATAGPGTGTRSSARITVVGASAAGLAAVEALRRAGWDGAITLVGDEPHLPYDRPPLSKQLLSGAWEPGRLALRDAEKLAALDLDLRLGTRATALDAGARKVSLDDGSVLECAGVVIATGVRARPLPGDGDRDNSGSGDSSGGALLLRTLDDALALRERLSAPGRRVAVAGMGVLGAEAAAVARELGHEVTLVGSGTVPMEGVLGTEVGALLAEAHRSHGVELRGGRRVVGPVHTSPQGEGDPYGSPYGVRLDDGSVVEADTVLAAVGSEAAVDWLEGSGLDAGAAAGVGCDVYCAAAPGVYAAGDVARWEHRTLGRALRVEHRMNATEQGMAAARNLLAELDPERFGERREFTPVPYFWSDQFGLKLQSYGHLTGNAGRTEVRVLGTDPLSAVALYGEGGRALGVLGIGIAPRQMRGLRALVAEQREWKAAVNELPTP